MPGGVPPSIPSYSFSPPVSLRLLEYPAQILAAGTHTIFPVTCRLRKLNITNPANAQQTNNAIVSIQDANGIYLVAPTLLLPGGTIEHLDKEEGEPMEGGVFLTSDSDGLHVRGNAILP